MNTIEIKISKEKALEKTKVMMTVVENFLLKKGTNVTTEEWSSLHEDLAYYFERINFSIQE